MKTASIGAGLFYVGWFIRPANRGNCKSCLPLQPINIFGHRISAMDPRGQDPDHRVRRRCSCCRSSMAWRAAPSIVSKFGSDTSTRDSKFLPLAAGHLHFPARTASFHILFNMLGLWMFGSDLERMWGSREFTKFFFICGIGAGILMVAGIASVLTSRRLAHPARSTAFCWLTACCFRIASSTG